METGLVFNIQRYCLNDGPGIRTTVFLKGCPLCCAWCHNPESIKPRPELMVVETRCIVCGECRDVCPLANTLPESGPLPRDVPNCTLCAACVDACPTGARQIIGRTMTAQEVMIEVLKDRVFFEESEGGLTISGGEPLTQPRFLVALLQAGRDAGVHTVLDTTGLGQTAHLLEAARLATLVLYDLKAFDSTRHQRLTGVPNAGILENLRQLSRTHRNIWIRLPLVPGFNDDPEDLARLADFVAGLRGIEIVSLLPFHRTGVHKFRRLGMTHELEGVESPSAQLIERVTRIFVARRLAVRVGS